jgi:uncharacterized membrane protein YfhO
LVVARNWNSHGIKVIISHYVPTHATVGKVHGTGSHLCRYRGNSKIPCHKQNRQSNSSLNGIFYIHGEQTNPYFFKTSNTHDRNELIYRQLPVPHAMTSRQRTLHIKPSKQWQDYLAKILQHESAMLLTDMLGNTTSPKNQRIRDRQAETSWSVDRNFRTQKHNLYSTPLTTPLGPNEFEMSFV